MKKMLFLSIRNTNWKAKPFKLARSSGITIVGLFSVPVFAAEKVKAISPAESLVPMLLGLLTILVIIFVLAYLFKKFTNFSSNGKNIQILETQMIGNKEKLMIVQVKQQQFLIGVTGQSISQLGELEKQITSTPQEYGATNPNQSSPSENSFSGVFSRLIKGEHPIFDAKPETKGSERNRSFQEVSR